MKKHILVCIACLMGAAMLHAEAPANYYAEAEGKSGEDLRKALYTIIGSHTNVKYDGLYNVYPTSDVTDDGKVWDMYSTCTWEHGKNQCGNYSKVCDCYNREHSVPQSWFNKANPMVADAFHVYPTDGKVNGQRSNYPFGECSGGKNLGGKALGRLGSSTFSGYSGTVFEPDDQYKGDFARTYFYMATCYANINFTQADNGNKVFTYSENSEKKKIAGFTTYAVNLFMKWHRNDAVSEKETNRNDAVYAKQKNRNPFIDHPELAEYIWGDKKGQKWYSNGNTPIEQVAFQSLTLYPNPAHSFVTVTAETAELNYTILTLSGQTLAQGRIASGASIALGDLQNGLYLLRLEADGRQQIEKLMVNR